MKKTPMIIIFMYILSLLSACSLGHEKNTLEEASYRTAGKGDRTILNRTNQKQDPASALEQRIESVPDVLEANVLFYGDNLIVGMDTTGPALPTVVDAGVKQELQGEARDYLIYLVTEEHPDLLAHIASMRERIRRGEKVEDQEMLNLVNTVWKSVVPFNFLSKS